MIREPLKDKTEFCDSNSGHSMELSREILKNMPLSWALP